MKMIEFPSHPCGNTVKGYEWLTGLPLAAVITHIDGNVICANQYAKKLLKPDDSPIEYQPLESMLSFSDTDWMEMTTPAPIRATLIRDPELKQGVTVYWNRLSNSKMNHIGYLFFITTAEAPNEQSTRALAHELSQPLQSILGYTQGCVNQIQSGMVEPAKLCEILETIHKQALYAGDVVKRLRATIQATAGKEATCDANMIVEDAVDFFTHAFAENNIKHQVYIEQYLPLVKVDKVQIKQALINIIKNAIEACLVNHKPERIIVISTKIYSLRYIEICVQDNGCGFKADPNGVDSPASHSTKMEGFGMGLSLTKKIVESHGGKLLLSSNENYGTVMQILLPISKNSD